MIDIKTPNEIEVMREGGKRLGEILQELLELTRPGVTLLEIEEKAAGMIGDFGGSPSFQTVEGYKFATCLCVNEVVVHGIPTKYAVKDGDVLTIDIGMLYKGFHTDTAWSIEVGHGNPSHDGRACESKQHFLDTGKTALQKALTQAVVGNHIGDISRAIQETIEHAGYSVVRSLVGHGVGRKLHEEPQVPGLSKVPSDATPPLVRGMTIAIEVIYAQGNSTVVYDNDDGWSIATKDRSLSAVFEHTVALENDKTSVLTDVSEKGKSLLTK